MRKIGNKELDEIGKRLVRADVIQSREVERIVANPALFDSIRTRIASETKRPANRRWFLNPAVASCASVVLVAVVAFAFLSSGSKDLPKVPAPIADSSSPAKTNRSRQADQIVDNNRFKQESSEAPRVERISSRPTVRQFRSRPTVAQQMSHHEGEFYAVSYAGDPNETERGGRIIRVDIPRTTLFAMGIDVPLENETETVKADLLVGNDGVTRGIRVVK
jgi:hypothetical protein